MYFCVIPKPFIWGHPHDWGSRWEAFPGSVLTKLCCRTPPWDHWTAGFDPGLAIHNSDWNFQQSRVFTCFVLFCGGFFANGLSTVCPFCRNWYDSWSLAHSSPTVSSVLANSIAQWISWVSCELSRPSLLWRSWLPCAPMWAWKRASTWHMKQGPVPFVSFQFERNCKLQSQTKKDQTKKTMDQRKPWTKKHVSTTIWPKIHYQFLIWSIPSHLQGRAQKRSVCWRPARRLRLGTTKSMAQKPRSWANIWSHSKSCSKMDLTNCFV